MSNQTEQRGDYSPSYREQTVDATLAEFDTRLTRLERGAYVGIGFGIAAGGGEKFITVVASLI